MSKSNELDVKMKFGLKSFITVVAILLAVLIFVGVLTYVIPAGRYTVYTNNESQKSEPFYEYTENTDLKNQIVVDESGEFVYTELTEEQNTSRLPFYRWILAPFEALMTELNHYQSDERYETAALLEYLEGTAEN